MENPALDASHTVPPGLNTETLLVVDDEPPILMLVEKILSSAGYNVLCAESGRQALKIWSEDKDQIDLVLTDIMLPGGILGSELCARLKADKPELKVLFSSGYTDAGKSTAATAGSCRFLQKPYMPKTLMQAVRDFLDE